MLVLVSREVKPFSTFVGDAGSCTLRNWRYDDDGPLFHARYFSTHRGTNPSAHRSLIAFAAWSSFAHAVVMSAPGLAIASERAGFLTGSAVLVVVSVASSYLDPRKQPGQQAALR